MAKISTELSQLLQEFMVVEIGCKALDGITYALIDKQDRDSYNRYLEIRKEATKCGFSSSEVFRLYEVTNGYIFDMDMSLIRQLTSQLLKDEAKRSGDDIGNLNLIRDMPEQRRNRDIAKLARQLKNRYDAGERTTEIALFSRNSTDKININCLGPNGERLRLVYASYALKPHDIEALNERYLIPAGFRVKSIRPCEILPSKTGVSFIFNLQDMNEAVMEHTKINLYKG